MAKLIDTTKREHVPTVSGDIERMPSISEAAGSSDLTPWDQIKLSLKESALKGKASAEIREEAIAIAKSAVIAKLRLDETFVKSKVMILDHGRSGALKAQVAQMVDEALKKNGAHVFQFGLDLSEEEARRLRLLDESLAAGRITQDRYERQRAVLSKKIDHEIERGAELLEAMIEELIRNMKSLIER